MNFYKLNYEDLYFSIRPTFAYDFSAEIYGRHTKFLEQETRWYSKTKKYAQLEVYIEGSIYPHKKVTKHWC